MVITIDGPAGSGKSTAARRLADRLGIAYLDTGAMYRAIAYRVMLEGALDADEATRAAIARRTQLTVECRPAGTRVLIDGRDASDAIRSMAVSRATLGVAAVQPIRDLLVEKQRAVGAELGSFVSEGRDQGSVVFPDADVKFVLEATDQSRAKRRFDDMHAVGEKVTPEEVLAHVRQRDAGDAVQWAPLLEPGAAAVIDTTSLTIDEVIDRLEAHVRSVGENRPARSPTP